MWRCATAELRRSRRGHLSPAIIEPEPDHIFSKQYMNPGLLAPQFGLGRRTQPAVGESAGSAGLAGPQQIVPMGVSQAGPTVVVKRRRLLQTPGGELHGECSQPTEIRSSKVFRLAPSEGLPLAAGQAGAAIESAVPASPEIAGAASEGAETECASQGQARRRRDRSRDPKLIRHEVFELQALEHQLAAPLEPDADISMAGVVAAMAQLRKTLDAMVQARQAYIALDRHLQALGLPGGLSEEDPARA